MTTINITEAKQRLAKYGRRAAGGENILVMLRHKPAFVLSPAQTAAPKPKKPGLLRGKLEVSKSFARTPTSVIRAFEGPA